MMLHPEVQAKAQAEIDAVVGNDRWPAFTDRPSLPFCDAIMSETLRWGVPVPLSKLSSHYVRSSEKATLIPDVPHRLMQDDVYAGMHLPMGSLVGLTSQPSCHAELMSACLPLRSLQTYGTSLSVFATKD